MNREEVKKLDRVEIEVRNNTRQLEKIITNELPCLKKELAENTGKLKVLIPLIVACISAIAGLYVLIINMVG